MMVLGVRWVAVAVWLVLPCAIGCSGGSPSGKDEQPRGQSGDRPKGSTEPSRGTVKVKGDGIELRGKWLVFPLSLESLAGAIGEPSRRAEKINWIHTWDDLGVYAYTKPESDRVNELVFAYDDLGKYPFLPKKAFPDGIAVGSHVITPASGTRELASAGFASPQMFPFLLDLSVDGTVVTVTLDDKTQSRPASVIVRPPRPEEEKE